MHLLDFILYLLICSSIRGGGIDGFIKWFFFTILYIILFYIIDFNVIDLFKLFLNNIEL